MKQATVYLVGAGPGDSELITVKGLRLLRQADVILYDHLIADELLDAVRHGAECICVGKRAADHTLPQDAINRLLVEQARAGKTVVRLKGGDCFLFGRGGEEAQACAEAGVPFEIVPGITSALAAGAYAGIPPTHRDYTSDVAIVTGHRKKGDNRPIHIPQAGTLVFLMSVGNIDNILRSLREAGYSPDTKIAAVERGTCYDQRVVEGTLETFAAVIAEKPLRTPAVFIVGKVVELRSQLDWYAQKPVILHLGTRPDHYRHLGTIVHRPIIDCRALPDTDQTRQVLRTAGRFDWIVFTSSNGIRFFFSKLFAAGRDVRLFADTKFAVIGRRSAGQLSTYGINADLCAAEESSAGLVAAFEPIDIAGKSVLLPQAETSSPELPEGLTARGAHVEKLPVYQTVEQEIADVDLDYIDRVLFTSGSTVRAFVNKFGSMPAHIKALCLGRPTQIVAKDYNIDAAILDKF